MDEDVIALLAALYAGPAITLSPLSEGFAPRVEIGLSVPAGPVRVQPYAEGSYLAVGVGGAVSDARVTGGDYDWQLRQRVVSVGGGVGLQLPGELPVTPEAELGLRAVFQGTRADGSAATNPFGETRESYARAGLVALVGAARTLGPGEIVGHVGYTGAPLVGSITGESSASSLLVEIGYRGRFDIGGPAADPAAADPRDPDADGVKGEADLCPDVAGPSTTEGCPDTDGDGVIDPDDQCPAQAGPIASFGCP